MPGPNDFYIDPKLGLQSGLGPLEPKDEDKLSVAQAQAELRLKEEALAAASAEIRNEARSLEERAAEFDRRERELKARLRAVEAGEQEVESQRRALATERPATAG